MDGWILFNNLCGELCIFESRCCLKLTIVKRLAMSSTFTSTMGHKGLLVGCRLHLSKMITSCLDDDKKNERNDKML